jgi:hypothetical protein
MPAAVKVIRARDFIRAQADGSFLIEDSLRLLGDIAAAAAGLKEHDVVVDVRQADSPLSAADLWTLAQKLAEYRHVHLRKTAVLCPLERFDKARFFAMCAENQGYRIRAFTDYEAAMEWIISEGGES